MTEDNEQNTNQFKERLGGFFHELFRIVGTSIPPYAHERFRSVGERMVLLVEQVSKHKAIQVVTKLQRAVSAGFDKMESELNNVQTLTLSHQTMIGDLIAGQKHIAKSVGEIEDRLNELEKQIARRYGPITKSKEVQAPVNRLNEG